MTTFADMWRVIIWFLVIWAVYTYLIYRKAKACGTYFMNMKNGFFMGYVGLSIGLVFSIVLSLMRL